ncbi:hypothetical protein AB8E32_08195 [Marinomonas polaris]|uniref:hypothetical protein n=1 Tax=Marinomonas polaris TaxID=293552 RepID=UPI003512A66A
MKNEDKTISQMSMSVINYFNKRPILSLSIVVVIVLDIIWLNYANFFDSGILTYFEYRPQEAGSITLVGIIAIVFLIKKVDK